MGLLVDGQWEDRWYDTSETEGRFQREEAQFRHWLSPANANASGEAEFPAVSGRYHLYVSLACPWAHRTLIYRKLKELESHIGVSVVHPHMLEQDWTFQRDFPGSTGDQLYGLDYLHQIYTRTRPQYSGRVTVPVLWDRERETIVSNESADIIRMFNSAFNALTGNELDFYPEALRPQIDALNQRIYDTVNNGVYKSGFATTQSAYEAAVKPLFESLDWLEERLSAGGPYLLGPTPSEADWRLFPTLIRFDAVYVCHFKCNLRQIKDYPALSEYTRRLYHHPGIAETVDLNQNKAHYYYSHPELNPQRIVPLGPDLDWLNEDVH